MKPNRIKHLRFFIVLAALVMVGSMTQSATAQIVADWFVDGATGSDSDTGQTWGQAFATPRKALAAAQPNSGEVIFVAAGTYYPDEINGGDSDDRDDTFSLVNDVSVYGGFLNGDVFGERNPEVNITILSGDIDQNDGPNFANNDENSINVVTAEDVDPSAVLDGFTITAGNADDLPGGIAWGAGIICRDFAASPTINRCIIKDNFAWVWAAGMYCGNNSRAIISNCTFQGNVAQINESGTGAAVYCNNAAPAIIKCTFDSNQARYDGGAIFVKRTSDPPEDLTITNCIFTNNQARHRGGAIYVHGPFPGAEVVISNSLFVDNWAQGIPGDPQSGRGGAIYCFRGRMAVICCTIVDNQAVEGGGVAIRVNIALDDKVAIDLRDTILFDNVADGGEGEPPGNQLWVNLGPFYWVLTVDYCDVQGGLADVGGGGSEVFWGDNNIDDDPLFVDPTNGDYRLDALSPCIDVGDPDETVIPMDEFDVDQDGDFDEPTPDLDLNDRVIDADGSCIGGGIVDMGAYEFECPWDLDGDCSVGASDLLILLVAWGDNPGGPPDFDCNGIVGATDLLALLVNWGLCACGVGPPPLSLEEELADACLSQEDWDAFVAVMTDPNASQEDKDRYYCWMNHYLFHCNRCNCTHPSECPSPDPFG
ncbi:MAG: right-handed parallel beta-helix repeat-containing protein [Phycisphaerales bacterium]